MSIVTSISELESIYGEANPRSLVKEITFLNEPYRAFVEAAPFVIMATSGAEGLDCSPKGDAPGFVRVIDEHTLALPDRLGNNRIDNLRNLIADPRISLLFLIPGVGETLRVNGTAQISADPELLESFTVQGKQPRTVILITIEAVYFHCAKALVRSKLWDPATQISRSELPSAGEILQCITEGAMDGAQYDREYPERIKATLY
ncbi:MAG: pyridoxamine 5'-phosphate oxidase family protein [Thermomicrobiales bacterium]